MRRTITVREMLEELKQSDAALVVVNGEAEDREEAVEYLEADIRRGVVRPDREVEVGTVVSYTFRLTTPTALDDQEACQ